MADRAPELNAALADAAVTVLELEAETYDLGSSVIIPPGKSVRGKGRNATKLSALSTFNRNIATNGLLVTQEVTAGAKGTGVFDLAILVNKVGLGGGLNERIQGLMMLRAIDFSVHRVDVYDATGYAHFARGDPEATATVFSSGVYRDCRTHNAHIHFEQMACRGVLLDNCHARPGAGDITCASFFHPLTGARDITIQNSTGKGMVSAGVEITANVLPIQNVRLLDVEIEVEPSGGSGGQALVITAGGLGVDRLYARGCRFVSKAYIGAYLRDLTNGILSDTYIEGKTQGMTFQNIYLTGSDSSVYGWHEGTGSAYGISGTGGEVYWRDGSIVADPRGTGAGFPISSNVIVSPTTALSLGGGFDFARTVLAPNATHSTTPTPIGATITRPWTFPVKANHRYQVILAGMAEVWTTAGGISVGVKATGTTRAIAGFLRLGANEIPLRAAGGIGTAGSFITIPNVSVANEKLILEAAFSYAAQTDGTVTVEFACTTAGVQAMIHEASTIVVRELSAF